MLITYVVAALAQAQIGSLHGAGTTNPSKLVRARDVSRHASS